MQGLSIRDIWLLTKYCSRATLKEREMVNDSCQCAAAAVIPSMSRETGGVGVRSRPPPFPPVQYRGGGSCILMPATPAMEHNSTLISGNTKQKTKQTTYNKTVLTTQNKPIH